MREVQLWLPGLWIQMNLVPRWMKHEYPIVNVEGLLKDGSIVIMHYAYGDGDGMMPSFCGWFVEVKSAYHHWYRGIDPVAWRPLLKGKQDNEREKNYRMDDGRVVATDPRRV